MKLIAITYIFRSDSNAAKLYQTLHYTDGTTSCDCPGWTRRVQPNGSRTCKHTRSVEAGIASQTCTRFVQHVAAPLMPGFQPVQAKPMVKAIPVISQQDLPGRVFDLD